jgi:hypothetical protein
VLPQGVSKQLETLASVGLPDAYLDFVISRQALQYTRSKTILSHYLLTKLCVDSQQLAE